VPVNSYQYIQLYQAQAELATRLYDSTNQFWSLTELTIYIQEALQTWNALTNYWRGDFAFTTSFNVGWYDLTQIPTTVRPLTVTYPSIYSNIQYGLLESVSWPWTGNSNQFSPNDLMNAVMRRRDEILSITGCYHTVSTLPAIPARIVVPDNVIDIRRVAYFPLILIGGAGGAYGVGPYGAGPYGAGTGIGPFPSVVNLFPEDTWGEQAFNTDYTTTPAGMPTAYLTSTLPQLSFDTDIPVGYGGNFEMLSINAGPVINTGSVGTTTIPDDWTHLIKWGALADLLSRESNAKDSARAQYCELRYQMGLKVMVNASALLAVRVNNVAVQIDSVRAADLFNVAWQGQVRSKPKNIYHAGLNLIATSPYPDIGYGITVTAVQNAPLPVNQMDFIQLGRDEMEAVLSYAQHIASFKMGGLEFSSTMPLFKKFLDQAQVYGLKLQEIAEFTQPLYNLSQLEENMNPRMSEAD
jgi:hypothetical protein